MFASTSRYYALETATYETPDGREIAYVRRRFLPQGDDLPLLVEVTLTEGDRLDLIAARTLGDAEQFWRVCDANDALNPADLVEPGRTLRVPVPQIEEPR
jgi:nucleoid-associated protein YgaU